MVDSVKLIFYTLLGTICAIVIGSVTVELFNVSVSAPQLRQMQKLACIQACDLYTQETYKGNGANKGAVDAPPLLGIDGTIVPHVPSNFYTVGGREYILYDDNDRTELWRALYGPSNANFRTFMRSNAGSAKYNIRYEGVAGSPSEISDAFPQLDSLQLAAENNGHINLPPLSWDSGDDEQRDYFRKSLANTMYDELYTPVNIGIPYMDDEVVNNMFRWNLAKLLSNCDSDLIRHDQTGWYALYKGFRCYISPDSGNQDTEGSSIDSYNYVVCNLDNPAGRDALTDLTNMYAVADATGHAGVVGIGLQDQHDLEANDQYYEQNNYVTVVGINYHMNISYEGITPIRHIYAWIMNYVVAGYNGQHGATRYGYLQDTANNNEIVTGSAPRKGPRWVSNGRINSETGLRGLINAGAPGGMPYPSTGKLIYTLVR